MLNWLLIGTHSQYAANSTVQCNSRLFMVNFNEMNWNRMFWEVERTRVDAKQTSYCALCCTRASVIFPFSHYVATSVFTSFALATFHLSLKCGIRVNSIEIQTLIAFPIELGANYLCCALKVRFQEISLNLCRTSILNAMNEADCSVQWGLKQSVGWFGVKKSFFPQWIACFCLMIMIMI